MNDVMTPIIVNERGDVTVFPSIEDAVSYLEPIDVQNGEFVAYDGAGRRVRLSVKTTRRRILFGLLSTKTETVALDGTTEDATAELRAVLVAALSREDATTLSSSSLSDLVRLASERFGRGSTEERAVLHAYLAGFRTRSYRDLVALLDTEQHAEQQGSSGVTYQLQANVFWDDEPGGNLRVLASLTSGGWRDFFPLCEDFIMAPDGSFVGE